MDQLGQPARIEQTAGDASIEVLVVPLLRDPQAFLLEAWVRRLEVWRETT
jgi:hypothetical protein